MAENDMALLTIYEWSPSEFKQQHDNIKKAYKVLLKTIWLDYVPKGLSPSLFKIGSGKVNYILVKRFTDFRDTLRIQVCYFSSGIRGLFG